MKKDFAIVALLVLTPLISSCSTSADTAVAGANAAAAGANTEEAASTSSADAPAGDDAEPADDDSTSAEGSTDAPPDDPSGKIYDLLSEGKLDEAQKSFAAALAADPDHVQLMFLRPPLASALDRAGRSEEAFAHREAVVDQFLSRAAREAPYQVLLAEQLDYLVSLANRLGGAERAAQTLDRLDKRAQEVDGAREAIVASLVARRAILLASADRVGEARSLLNDALKDAASADASPADPTRAAFRRASLLFAMTSVEAADDNGDPDAAWDRLLDDVGASAAALPDDRFVGNRLAELVTTRARQFTQRDPDRADELLDRLNAFEELQSPRISEADLEKPMFLANRYEYHGPDSTVRDLRIDIAETRRRMKQYGTPAELPLHADRWVNADEPPTRDQLKGKVVLLDFFAVWCGPCIATFPHLRDWQDKYADQGFQIIGVSEYHGYGWNEELGHSQRVDGITPDAEREDLVKFAKHHELPYPIALVPDNSLQEHYFVNGIPHVVLIDRAGKVRLFRIGSGEQNAHDLEAAIETALAEE